ncbi:hypothetical protein P4576_03975 [Peribacillus frigoritolerans]|uniref:hypothetical protein n=1 Tax=Peribacillus frigoritolerans TaxID=450367 RepID=UPI002E247FBE|nr:hypothetical protein [Peribacillus frigoritolerans]
MKNSSFNARTAVTTFIPGKYEIWSEENMSKSLKDIVPPHLQQKALDSIPALSHFIEKGKKYFTVRKANAILKTCWMISSRNGAS